MPSDPKRPAKRAKKHSISGQRRQREKKAGEAETGAGAAKNHVSQNPRQKAAINPAKRGGEVHESAAHKKEPELSRSRKILELCEGVKDRIVDLLRLSANGDQLALFNLVGIVAKTANRINTIATLRPELVRPLAQISLAWPGLLSRNKAHREEMRMFINKIELGLKAIGGGASQLDKRATETAFKLYLRLQKNQLSLRLPPLTTTTWDVWFRAGWKMLLLATSGHPEKDEFLREIGKHYGEHSKNTGQQKKVTPATREANIRAGIRKQLRQSFKGLLGCLSKH